MPGGETCKALLTIFDATEYRHRTSFFASQLCKAFTTERASFRGLRPRSTLQLSNSPNYMGASNSLGSWRTDSCATSIQFAPAPRNQETKKPTSSPRAAVWILDSTSSSIEIVADCRLANHMSDWQVVRPSTKRNVHSGTERRETSGRRHDQTKTSSIRARAPGRCRAGGGSLGGTGPPAASVVSVRWLAKSPSQSNADRCQSRTPLSPM
jgi:hypothetical protein